MHMTSDNAYMKLIVVGERVFILPSKLIEEQ